MKNDTVTCDHCHKDITSTSNCDDFRIELQSVRLPANSGIVTLMAVYPELTRPHHFCTLSCLKKWLNPEHSPEQPTISVDL